MKNPYKVIHSSCELLRKKVHVVLVRPEYSGNLGSAARAVENMGVFGPMRIVSDPSVLEWGEARKMAKHASHRLAEAKFFPNLEKALEIEEGARKLVLASSARVGSAHRPHPLRVREAVSRAVGKVVAGEYTDLFLVFGPEADGLTNEEIDRCDWVVTIPSHAAYRSVNLAQAVMIFAHEVNESLLLDWEKFDAGHPAQRDKLIFHLLKLAEDCGFVRPGDPFKMRPRLEEIFSQLPAHIPEARTLHGLIDQVRRSVKAGMPDLKGHYKHFTGEVLDGN